MKLHFKCQSDYWMPGVLHRMLLWIMNEKYILCYEMAFLVAYKTLETNYSDVKQIYCLIKRYFG